MKTKTHKLCPYCKESFKLFRTTDKFCSPECKAKDPKTKQRVKNGVIKSEKISKNLYRLSNDTGRSIRMDLGEELETGVGSGKEKRSNKIPKRTGIKKVSKKQAAINRTLEDVYAQIENEREAFCESCGRTSNLTPSHAIPRSIRKDLETDKEGIFIQCMGGSKSCHESWEHQSLNCLKFKNLNQMLGYVKLKDEGRYLFIVNKLNYQIESSK